MTISSNSTSTHPIVHCRLYGEISAGDIEEIACIIPNRTLSDIIDKCASGDFDQVRGDFCGDAVSELGPIAASKHQRAD